MPRPPLREVAHRAGVSEPTVSRVLNGRVGVADGTRAKVVEALADLGFHDIPEPSAVRTGVVGLITGELTNPVFGEMSEGIITRLARHGLVTNLGVATRNLISEERYIDEFVTRGVDGLVMIAGAHARTDADAAMYARLVERDIPFVLVNGREIGLEVPYVWCDESLGAQRAVQHLLSLGHRRIGAVLGQRLYVGTVRHDAGVRAAIEGHVELHDTDIVSAPFTYEGGLAGARQLLARGITGIICANDLMALGAVAAARQRTLSVPDDVSIVGYDGTDFSATTDPALTTLRQPFDDMGELIADALVSEIDRSRRFRDSYVFAPELIVRASTGAAKVD